MTSNLIEATPPRQPRRALILASALALSLGLQAAAAEAGVDTKFESKRGQLQQVKQREGVLTSTIEGYSVRISGLVSRVARLREHEAVVEERLAAAEAKLNRAKAELDAARRRLLRLRAQLHRALEVLSKRLVAIYESGTPDTLTVLLNSDGWDDLATRAEYLQTIQDLDETVVGRVRELRDRTRATVERLRVVRNRIQAARNRIAAQEAALADARASVESKQTELLAVRSTRETALTGLRQHARVLEGDVSDLQAKIERQLATAAGPELPAGPPAPSGGATSSRGLIWPLDGILTSGFGMRWGSMHEGIDIAAPTGTPIHAAASGTVTIAAYTGGYGNYTCIDHGGGLSTCYGHQDSFATSVGASVAQGEVIGYVGSTGHSTGPHCHFEVRVDGVAQDPLGYL